jgi:hypothetical protein
MKKYILGLMLGLMLLPAVTFADTRQDTINALTTLINLLEQQVLLLQQEFNQLYSSSTVATSTNSTITNISTQISSTTIPAPTYQRSIQTTQSAPVIPIQCFSSMGIPEDCSIPGASTTLPPPTSITQSVPVTPIPTPTVQNSVPVAVPGVSWIDNGVLEPCWQGPGSIVGIGSPACSDVSPISTSTATSTS